MKINLWDMLREWQQFEPNNVRIGNDGAVQIVFDSYYEEFREGAISGECGFSHAQAILFAAVCSAIEERTWHTKLVYPYDNEGQRLQYRFSRLGTEERGPYLVHITWLNPLYSDHAIRYQATGDKRGSTMLEAYLKLLRHASELKQRARLG